MASRTDTRQNVKSSNTARTTYSILYTTILSNKRVVCTRVRITGAMTVCKLKSARLNEARGILIIMKLALRCVIGLKPKRKHLASVFRDYRASCREREREISRIRARSLNANYHRVIVLSRAVHVVQ